MPKQSRHVPLSRVRCLARLTPILALVLVFTASAFPRHSSSGKFSIEQIMSYPFPSELTASRAGSRIAWVLNERGVRNIWVAEGPQFQPRQLTNYTADDGQELSSVEVSPDGKYVLYIRGGDSDANWPAPAPDPTSSPVAPKKQIYSVPFTGGQPMALAEDGDNPSISPKGDLIAFEKDAAIWVVSIDGSAQPKKLFFARGNNVSPEWSPDGTRLAFVSERGDHSFIGVFAGDSNPIVYLAPSTSRDSSPRWSPDGKRIAFIRRSGGGGAPEPVLEMSPKPWEIWTADASTGEGEGKVLWKSPETLRGSVPETDGETNLHWAAEGRIVFLANLDGWPHLYSIRQNGGDPLLLTPGSYMVEHVHLSPDGRYLVCSANTGKEPDDIDRRHLLKVPVDRPETALLTNGNGLEWRPVFTGDGKNIVFIGATAQQPPVPALIAADGGAIKSLGEDRIPRDFPASQLITPRAVLFKAPDGVEIHGQLFDHESGTGKRPAIIYVHGGPMRQMLLGWNYSEYYSNAYAMNQYLANHGYVVLSVNYRLGIGYGFEFHHPQSCGSSGAAEYQDVRAAADYLHSLPPVDPNRIAIYGGSHGGFLTAMALARNSDIFAAGVDLNGVHDWTAGHSDAHWLFERESFERPPDLTQALETAWRSSPDYYVDNWKSPVLLIHGDDDHNVSFSQTVDLAQRLRQRKIPYEELILPDETHAFMRYISWERTNQAIASFFNRELKPNVR